MWGDIFFLWIKGCGDGKLLFENEFGVKTQFKIMEPRILKTMEHNGICYCHFSLLQ